MTLRLNGSTSGYTEIDAPAVAGSNTLVLPTGAGSAYQVVRNGATAGSLEFTEKIVSGTAQNSTSGTSIDFTGIPSWVKRVTVMFNGVSTNGASQQLVQLGSSSGVQSTGYLSQWGLFRASVALTESSTAGFGIWNSASTSLRYTHMIFTVVSGNVWVSSHSGGASDSGFFNTITGGGSVTLSGTLDRVRITTVNGTDTFDAGSINILYE
jgi:hypothetical protein